MAAAIARIITLSLAFLGICTVAYAGTIVDSRITAEVVLDGMTHYDTDQGLKDYTVSILEVTREIGKAEITQRQKIFYFMAPNVYLTMVGDRPETLQNDASFMLLLSQYDLTREKDIQILGEDCYKVVATPTESAYKKYTKTYYVSRADYRKIRIESIRSEMDREFILYRSDFIYDKYTYEGKEFLLVSKSEATKYDQKDNLLMEQTNTYAEYKFNTGLTRKFFEDILKEYNIYYSEGT